MVFCLTQENCVIQFLEFLESKLVPVSFVLVFTTLDTYPQLWILGQMTTKKIDFSLLGQMTTAIRRQMIMIIILQTKDDESINPD